MNNIVWSNHNLSKEVRSSQKGQKPCILWFTGLSGSGKTTISNALELKLFSLGFHTYLLDGDNLRYGLNKDLGFSEVDRNENIRRVGEVAKLFVDSGIIVLAAFISPYKNDRNRVRNIVDNKEFIEVFVDTSLETCEQRDPKGLYKKARKGEIKNFTGIDSPYEKPDNPELHLKDNIDLESKVDIIIDYLIDNKYINKNREGESLE